MPNPQTVESPPPRDGSAKLATLRVARWPRSRQGLAGLALFTIILSLCFSKPLATLVRLSLHNDFYSHILLIPFISGYLIWLKRLNLKLNPRPSWPPAVLLFIAGLSILVVYRLCLHSCWTPQPNDRLAVSMLAFFSLLLCGTFIFLGAGTLRQVAFPAAFLIFMVPFPDIVERGIETFLQHGSAWAAC